MVARGMRGMPRRSREWRFVPSVWKNEESEDRHEGDVQRAQFPRRRSISKYFNNNKNNNNDDDDDNDNDNKEE